MIPQSNPGASYAAHREAIDAAVRRVLASGWYILGREVQAFEVEFAEALQAKWSLGVANGTDAIELALRAAGVRAGDGVLTVSHTAVATVAAIARIGAVPLFVDVEPARYTMSPQSLRDALAAAAVRPKAIVVVHLYGQAADLPAILELAERRGLPVVEDCAQAHGATLNGRTLGTFGDLGCFSFYPTKNLGAFGDGGAVIGRDDRHAAQVRMLREYGWQTRYVSAQFGVNSRLDELHAAILRAKLPHLDSDNAARRRVADLYDRRLAGAGLELPHRAPGAAHVFHQYVVQVAERDRVRAALTERGVGTLVHYPAAVHQQAAYADPQLRPVPLPNTEALIPRILSLPIYPELTAEQAEQVCAALTRCLA